MPQTPREAGVLAYFKKQHAALNRNFSDLCSVVTRLYHAPDEVDWPSTEETLHHVLNYFANDFSTHQKIEENLLFSRLLPKLMPEEKIVVAEIAAEHEGLQRLIELLIVAAKPWIKTGVNGATNAPPSRAEIETVYRLVMELRGYLGSHEKTEDEKLLPVAAALLDQDDFKAIDEELP